MSDTATEQIAEAQARISRGDHEGALDALDDAKASVAIQSDPEALKQIAALAGMVTAATKGGVRMRAEELRYYALAGSAPASTPTSPTALRLWEPDRGPALWITVGAIGLMAVGAFGPWAKVLAISVSGTDGSNDGWLVVGAAVAAGLLVWMYSQYGERNVLWLVALAGVGGAGVGLFDRRHLRGLGGLIQVGWGLNLVLASSVALVVMSFVLRSRTVPRTLGADEAVEGDAEEVVAADSDPEMGRLQRLGKLRDKGLISDEEFEAKRTEILANI